MISVQLNKSTAQAAINNNCKPFWMSSRIYNFSFFPFPCKKYYFVSSAHVQRICLLLPIYVRISVICNFYAAHQADFLFFFVEDAVISSNIFIIQHNIAFVNVILLHSILQNAIRIMCNIDLLPSLALLQRTSFTFRSLFLAPYIVYFFQNALLRTNVSYT